MTASAHLLLSLSPFFPVFCSECSSRPLTVRIFYRQSKGQQTQLLLSKCEGRSPHPTMGNQAQQDEVLTLLFNCCPPFFQKTLKSYPPVLNYLVACQDGPRRGMHHTNTSSVLHALPPPKPPKSNRGQEEQGHSAAWGSKAVVFLLRRSGPEQPRQGGPQSTRGPVSLCPAFVRAGVRCSRRQHNPGGNISHIAKMETR